MSPTRKGNSQHSHHEFVHQHASSLTSRPHLYGDWACHSARYSLKRAFQFLFFHHQRSSSSFVTKQIQWASQVEIKKIAGRVLLDNFCHSRVLIWMSSCYLNAKDVFIRVTLQQSPLRGFAFQQARGNSHFTTCNVGSISLHN